MKTKHFGVALSLVAVVLAVTLFTVPVMAKGPMNSQGNKVIQVANYYIIVSNRGWRQWRTDIDRFAIVLFTEGMNQKAIDAHTANGWSGPATISPTDLRYPHVSPYVDGDVEIIWKFHDIPAGSPP